MCVDILEDFMKSRINESQLRKLIYQHIKTLSESSHESLNELELASPMIGNTSAMTGPSLQQTKSQEQKKVQRDKKLANALKNVLGSEMGDRIAYTVSKMENLDAVTPQLLQSAIIADPKMKQTFIKIGQAVLTGQTDGGTINPASFQQAANIIKTIAAEEKKEADELKKSPQASLVK